MWFELRRKRVDSDSRRVVDAEDKVSRKLEKARHDQEMSRKAIEDLRRRGSLEGHTRREKDQKAAEAAVLREVDALQSAEAKISEKGRLIEEKMLSNKSSELKYVEHLGLESSKQKSFQLKQSHEKAIQSLEEVRSILLTFFSHEKKVLDIFVRTRTMLENSYTLHVQKERYIRSYDDAKAFFNEFLNRLHEAESINKDLTDIISRYYREYVHLKKVLNLAVKRNKLLKESVSSSFDSLIDMFSSTEKWLIDFQKEYYTCFIFKMKKNFARNIRVLDDKVFRQRFYRKMNYTGFRSNTNMVHYFSDLLKKESKFFKDYAAMLKTLSQSVATINHSHDKYHEIIALVDNLIRSFRSNLREIRY